jgi:hypothetical protein
VRELGAELRAALDEPPAKPGLQLLKQVWRDSRMAPSVAVGALALAATVVLFHGILQQPPPAQDCQQSRWGGITGCRGAWIGGASR